MKYVFDLDGTLCSHEKNYNDAKPLRDRIACVNRLFSKGHTIVIFTARGYETKIDWEEITMLQLKSWGVNYHELILGKPSADFYIDDKAIKDTDFKWS
jgi:hydroxymethylpyrimidine pyrophosphatase-like HAD family hydrolase